MVYIQKNVDIETWTDKLLWQWRF